MALLLFMVGRVLLGHFGSRKTVLAAGSLQMIAVATPLTLMLMWLGQPVQALLLSTARPCRPRRWSADSWPTSELTTRHTVAASPCYFDRQRALLALLAIWRGGRRRSSVLLEVLGVLMLFAAAALASRRLLHGLLAAARWATKNPSCWFLVRGGGCRRCCTRSAHPPPGAFLAGMVLGERLPSPRKATKPFRDVLSGCSS